MPVNPMPATYTAATAPTVYPHAPCRISAHQISGSASHAEQVAPLVEYNRGLTPNHPQIEINQRVFPEPSTHGSQRSFSEPSVQWHVNPAWYPSHVSAFQGAHQPVPDAFWR